MSNSSRREPKHDGVSRREMLAGTAVAALVAAVPASLRAEPPKRRAQAGSRRVSKGNMRRYMAASAVLGDGRILIVGGYDKPMVPGAKVSPLCSAVIFDPRTNTWFEAASMRLPRARHSAVALEDGRVAVLGGVGITPTASVEIYDPMTDTWAAGDSLAQPRYDHSAVRDGDLIYIFGGSSQGMLSTVERYNALASRANPRGRKV